MLASRRSHFIFIHEHQTSASLLVGGIRVGLSTGRSVRGTPTATVVVGATIVVGVVVRTIAVRVVVAAAAIGVGTAGGVVVVALAVGSGASHDDDCKLMKGRKSCLSDEKRGG